MLTRAIVVEVGTAITHHESKVKVRMPIINGIEGLRGATANEDLSWASIMTVPGLEVQYKEGDVVIVGFEDNNLDYPIILGHLKPIGNQVNKGARIAGEVQTLNVEDSFKAPLDTTIGKTNYSSIFGTINNT